MWQTFLNFMLNIMVGLYQVLDGNFILALVSFTVITRVLMLPVNLKQQRSSIKMQQIQPQVQAIQKKYKSDQPKMMEEFNKIGYNPTDSLLGCLPLVVQMPIFFALYRVINIMLQGTPLALLEMRFRLWETFDLASLLPIDNTFLWVNLAQPDPLFILPVLVAGTMFLQQKLMAPPAEAASKDPKKKSAADDNPAAQMQQSMLYTMPLMFGFFAMSFGSGLAIYFVISNLIGIGQGFIVRRNLAGERAVADVKREESKRLASKYDAADESKKKDEQSETKVSANGVNSTDSQNQSKKKKKKKGKK
ncbi:MAG: YidC/Oxa1 family membrane protein insertase [Cellvibrionaceae bacterium]|jgi:YidC/Oxa1 family membrane protein insertase